MGKTLDLDMMTEILACYQRKTAKYPVFIPLSQCDEEYKKPDQLVYDDLGAKDLYGPGTWPLAPKEYEKLATAASFAGLSIQHAFVHRLAGVWRLRIDFWENKVKYAISEGVITYRIIPVFRHDNDPLWIKQEDAHENQN